ncbi:hypothetical protein CEP52_017835 [Fusarium oligoseptatum]|uniref:Uncharacterized protein n=1 Tax=Fusarium oligoseptatum TaxID=2604345 RepID=A0A428RDR5_9HYPO|nr:hypothetical protein CEP52_017835 [Fusarium oligoseptatum]
MGEDRPWGYCFEHLDNGLDKAAQDPEESFPCLNYLACGKNCKKSEVRGGCANMDLDYDYTELPLNVRTRGPWARDL